MKFLFIALVLFSCNISPKKGQPYAVESLDTIATAPVSINAKPLLFEQAFVKGTTQQVKNSTFNLYGITIGHLKIASGRIVLCDPLHIDEYGIPFTQTFPDGDFPVQLSIAHFQQEELTAFARIKFSEAPVARWEMALQKDQEPRAVGSKDFHGYGVDGGVAVFIDEQASKALDQKIAANFDSELFASMDAHRHDNWRYGMYNFGAHNLAIFTTGFGDGRYATYIGFDAEGKPCRLLTDFGLFDWRKQEGYKTE